MFSKCLTGLQKNQDTQHFLLQMIKSWKTPVKQKIGTTIALRKICQNTRKYSSEKTRILAYFTQYRLRLI